MSGGKHIVFIPIFFVILYGFVWWNEKLVLYLHLETNKRITI